MVDQLSGPLCDALLEGSGGHARLRELEATSLFVIPLDRRRAWYRYHALFREFLLGELQRTEPEIVEKLHLRAADWYESNGSPQLAVEHLLDTPERERCVKLVTTLVLPTYSSGQMSTVEQWLTALGDDSIEGYPPLAILAGWVVDVERAHQGRRTVGRRRRGRLVGRGAAGWFCIVHLGARDAARRHVCLGSRADDGRRTAGGRRGAAVESMAGFGALPARRGAAAGRRQRAGGTLVRRSVTSRRRAGEHGHGRGRRIGACTDGDGPRGLASGGGAVAAGARDDRRASDG